MTPKLILSEHSSPDMSETNAVSICSALVLTKKRGGDIDLLLETPRHLSRMQRARLKMAIETAVGLPVDLVVRSEDTRPTAFQRIAKLHSAVLMDGGQA